MVKIVCLRYKQKGARKGKYHCKSEKQILQNNNNNNNNENKEFVVSCKSLRKFIWANIWNNFSEIFWNIVVLNFVGNHAWWRPLTAWNVTEGMLHQRYFPAKFWNNSKLLYCMWDNCDQLPVKLPRLLRGNMSPIKIVMCCLMRWFIMLITVKY